MANNRKYTVAEWRGMIDERTQNTQKDVGEIKDDLKTLIENQIRLRIKVATIGVMAGSTGAVIIQALMSAIPTFIKIFKNGG